MAAALAETKRPHLAGDVRDCEVRRAFGTKGDRRPYADAKEQLAGYQIDVDLLERAIEIAARVSIAHYEAAARRTLSIPERYCLITKAPASTAAPGSPSSPGERPAGW